MPLDTFDDSICKAMATNVCTICIMTRRHEIVCSHLGHFLQLCWSIIDSFPFGGRHPSIHLRPIWPRSYIASVYLFLIAILSKGDEEIV